MKTVKDEVTLEYAGTDGNVSVSVYSLDGQFNTSDGTFNVVKSKIANGI